MFSRYAYENQWLTLRVMAHVILGLLLIAPQSLYDLIKAFEAGVSLFYSASSGSIKRSLDRLVDAGQIEVATADPGSRGRKVYQVTDSGRREFHAWMTGPMKGPDAEAAGLPRLFFLGLLDAAERPGVLRAITARIEADLAGLESLSRHLETLEVPEGLEDVATHQFATLDYGLTQHRNALDWFRRHLTETEAES